MRCFFFLPALGASRRWSLGRKESIVALVVDSAVVAVAVLVEEDEEGEEGGDDVGTESVVFVVVFVAVVVRLNRQDCSYCYCCC